MLLSQVPHYDYRNHPLMEVICQLRFPVIPMINEATPTTFLEQVKKNYPVYQVREEHLPPKINGIGGPNPVMEKGGSIQNHGFFSQDGTYQINLTQDFISLSTRNYPGWNVFSSRLDQVLTVFIESYQPAIFQRIGLRYVNAVSRRSLQLESSSWKDLIAAPYLGILSEEDIRPEMVQKSALDTEFTIVGNARAKIHAGPAMIKSLDRAAAIDPEVKFILDFDLYMAGETVPSHTAPGLETLHHYANQLFEGAITDELHSAML